MRNSKRKQVLAAKVAGSARARDIHGVMGKAGSLYQDIVLKKGQGRWCVIRRVGGIGDVVMILPTLKALKSKFPQMELTFAIDMHTTSNNVYYELCKNLPYIDHLVDARYVQRSSYSKTVDISSVCIRYERSDLPSINRIDLFAKACGLPQLREKLPGVVVEKQESLWARSKLPGGRVIALHTASMEEKRSWPIENYIEIVERAAMEHPDLNFVVFDFNSKYRHWGKHSNVLDFSRTTLREMMALISEVDYFIGPDSGPMHLAGAVETQSLILFGSIPPAARINHYRSHRAITAEKLKCLGCWYANCNYNVKCMKDIKAGLVYDEMVKDLRI